MTAFADLPHDDRMALRTKVCDLGADIAGYVGTGLQVAMPNDWRADRAIEALLTEAGFSEVSRYYFPLGTDKPRDSLRHNGRYKGPPGMWLFVTFKAKA